MSTKDLNDVVVPLVFSATSVNSKLPVCWGVNVYSLTDPEYAIIPFL